MTPSLECPGSSSGPNSTGAYRIAWNADDGASVRVEENGTLLYEGPDRATTVTGRPDGDYVYRVGVSGTEDVAWADSCTVTVASPSLPFAFSVFGVGVVVFASLLVVVVRGHRAHRRGELHR